VHSSGIFSAFRSARQEFANFPKVLTVIERFNEYPLNQPIAPEETAVTTLYE
jgi:hypothetical protein